MTADDPWTVLRRFTPARLALGRNAEEPPEHVAARTLRRG